MSPFAKWFPVLWLVACSGGEVWVGKAVYTNPDNPAEDMTARARGEVNDAGLLVIDFEKNGVRGRVEVPDHRSEWAYFGNAPPDGLLVDVGYHSSEDALPSFSWRPGDDEDKPSATGNFLFGWSCDMGSCAILDLELDGKRIDDGDDGSGSDGACATFDDMTPYFDDVQLDSQCWAAGLYDACGDTEARDTTCAVLQSTIDCCYTGTATCPYC